MITLRARRALMVAALPLTISSLTLSPALAATSGSDNNGNAAESNPLTSQTPPDTAKPMSTPATTASSGHGINTVPPPKPQVAQRPLTGTTATNGTDQEKSSNK